MVSREESPLASRALARLGTMLLGRYRLVRLIGIGGMGAVYAGVHRNGHAVAVKILHDRLSNDPEIERLFRREAHLANNVNHPGVVPVIDDDVAEDGCVFLVMPLLDGDTLRGRWERHERRLPLDEVVVVAHAVLEVLQAAHAKKIVHRDIKPDNIFIERSGAIRVLDFGIARFFETNDPASATQSGRAIGTPAFMAPEQALGRLREVDGRTDIWALGATIFATLSGQFVHQAETGSEVIVHAATRPARPLNAVVPEVPAIIAAVVDRALAFDRGERWLDAAAMDRALLAAYEEAFARPVTAIEPLVSAPSPVTGTDVHSALTQAPVVAAAPEADVTPATDAGAAGVANVGGAQPSLADAISQGPVGNTNTAVERSADTPLRPRRARGVSGRTIGAILVGVLGLVASAWAWRARPSAHTQGPSSSTTTTTESRAEVLYRSALQLFRDGSTDRARALLDEANQIEPTLARAHLAQVGMAFYIATVTKEHYRKAFDFRASLDERERSLLDAYEPSVRATPALGETATRLEALARERPADVDLLVVLSRAYIRMDDNAAALRAAERATAIDPNLATAWLHAASALMRLARTDEGRRAYERCTAISPNATSCLRDLSELSTNDGDCARASELARHLVAIDDQSADWLHHLARTVFADGDNAEGALAVLQQKWSRLSDAERPMVQAQDRAHLALLRGDFAEALTQTDMWERVIAGDSDEGSHAIPAIEKMAILLELGQNEEVAKFASHYASQAGAWIPNGYFDYSLVPFQAQYLAGALTSAKFATRRDAWLQRAEHNERGTAALRWLEGYAAVVQTREEAVAALATVPNGAPLKELVTRDVEYEDTLGYVYLLAGRDDKARTSLARGVRSCAAIDSPLWHTKAHLHFGTLLERSGDRTGACQAYGVVRKRWGQERRSKSARAAATRMEALGCRP